MASHRVGPTTVVMDIGRRITKVTLMGQARPHHVIPTPSVLAAFMSVGGAPKDRVPLELFIRTVLLEKMNLTLGTVSVIVTLNTAEKRRWCELLTHTLSKKVARVSTVNAHAAALASAGSLSGMVLDVGYTESRCVPIVDGVLLESHCCFAPLGAVTVLEALRTQTLEANPSMRHVPRSVLEDIVFRVGEVLPKGGSPTTMEWATAVGSMTVSPQRAFEVLFDGSADTPDGRTLQWMVQKVLEAVSMVHRRHIAGCLVLCGGMASVAGFRKRLAQELLALDSPLINPSHVAFPRLVFPPATLPLVGASALASSRLL
eukprot:Sspe_Gene.110238::Locus_90642_Transcript_1_1_Confidence_1.000_Length_1009::g.110238::m.110238/K16576/ACTR10, ARP11; actin-related protein 10